MRGSLGGEEVIVYDGVQLRVWEEVSYLCLPLLCLPLAKGESRLGCRVAILRQIELHISQPRMPLEAEPASDSP